MRRLRHIVFWLMAACTPWLACGAAEAADVFVIASQPIVLSADDIKDVFLGEVQFAGATRLAPMDNGSVQAEFLERVMKMTPARYAAWWTKKSFRDGVNSPPVRAGDAQVLIFVKETPGGIGYVSSPPAGVHVIGKF